MGELQPCRKMSGLAENVSQGKHSSLFPGTEATKRKKRFYDVDLPVSTTEGGKTDSYFRRKKYVSAVWRIGINSI